MSPQPLQSGRGSSSPQEHVLPTAVVGMVFVSGVVRRLQGRGRWFHPLVIVAKPITLRFLGRAPKALESLSRGLTHDNHVLTAPMFLKRRHSFTEGFRIRQLSDKEEMVMSFVSLCS